MVSEGNKWKNKMWTGVREIENAMEGGGECCHVNKTLQVGFSKKVTSEQTVETKVTTARETKVWKG